MRLIRLYRDGTNRPYRCSIRAPGFAHLAGADFMMRRTSYSFRGCSSLLTWFTQMYEPCGVCTSLLLTLLQHYIADVVAIIGTMVSRLLPLVGRACLTNCLHRIWYSGVLHSSRFSRHILLTIIQRGRPIDALLVDNLQIHLFRYPTLRRVHCFCSGKVYAGPMAP
jgi:hypothetical protein